MGAAETALARAHLPSLGRLRHPQRESDGTAMAAALEDMRMTGRLRGIERFHRFLV
jgi:hypothetical protein